jgi:hypothetical protein
MAGMRPDQLASPAQRFAPFNRYRIIQQYLYEAGELRETVELFKRSKDGERPFARVEETAKMMASTLFDSPSTLRLGGEGGFAG